MTSAHIEPEDNGLTVLTVREGEASIRNFRFDCRGETSCRPDLGELLQLLERRRADIVVFLAHPNLVRALINELRRRGREIPGMVIAPPPDAADTRGERRQSVSLSGLSDSAYPQELLARLYEALRAAQNGDGALSCCVAEATQPHAALAALAQDRLAGPSPPENQSLPEPTAPPPLDADAFAEDASAAPGESAVADDAAPASADAEAPPGADEPGQTLKSPTTQVASPRQDGAAAAAEGPAAETTDEEESATSPDATCVSVEVDELSARLERILNQRLQRSQP